jgi:hypothetical protein
MGDVLEIAGFLSTVRLGGRDRGDCHPMSAIWAGK